MRQITVGEFLNAVEKNDQRVTEYSLGGDGSGGKCDCIGLIIGALRLAGLKWDGTHGSNWAARNAVDDLHRVDNASDLIPGMVVFKAREPGENGYDLPDRYKNSGDLRDYYHVGVVTSINPMRITHCTSVAGGIKVDDKLGAWHYAGYLKQVDYKEETMEPLYQAEVFAQNGKPVCMRSQPSNNGKVIEKIPCGVVVDVLEEINADWAKISDQNVIGYMMRRFLKQKNDDGNDTGNLFVMPLDDAVLLHDHLQAALEILNRNCNWG